MSNDDLTPDQASPKAQPVPTPVRGPADLAELKATDALLDRLAAGGLSARDRQDPLVSAFAQLRHSLDEPSGDAGLDVARLIEVLGERPLYVLDTDEAGDGTPADEPITLSIPVVGADESPARVIDVRDGATGLDEEATGTSGDRRIAARSVARVADGAQAGVGANVRSILSGGRRGSHGRQDDDTVPGWQRVMSQVALPAASVIALLALGSGVSAAVTGNPMAPVSGVSKVVQQLPGISNQPDVGDVQASLKEAGEIASTQPKKAQKLLDAADSNIDDLPSAVQPSLQSRVDDVRATLASVAASPSAAPSVSASANPPSATPTPSISPSATAPSSSAASPPPSSATVSPSAATVSPSVSSAAVAP